MIGRHHHNPGPPCNGKCPKHCHDGEASLVEFLLFFYGVAQAAAFMAGIIDHSSPPLFQAPKRWHYVFPAYPAGIAVGDFMARGDQAR